MAEPAWVVPSTYMSTYDDEDQSSVSTVPPIESYSAPPPPVPRASPEPTLQSTGISWAAWLWLLGLMLGLLGLVGLTWMEYQCDIPTQDELNMTIVYALDKLPATPTRTTWGSSTHTSVAA